MLNIYSTTNGVETIVKMYIVTI